MMQIPTQLKHKPVIVCENYENVDGRYAYKSDAKGLSLGLAQWNDRGRVDASAKVWRYTGEKWSRQSEELPLWRVLDLAILLARSAQYFQDEGYRHKDLYDKEHPQIDRVGLQGDAMTLRVLHREFVHRRGYGVVPQGAQRRRGTTGRAICRIGTHTRANGVPGIGKKGLLSGERAQQERIKLPLVSQYDGFLWIRLYNIAVVPDFARRSSLIQYSPYESCVHFFFAAGRYALAAGVAVFPVSFICAQEAVQPREVQEDDIVRQFQPFLLQEGFVVPVHNPTLTLHKI